MTGLLLRQFSAAPRLVAWGCLLAIVMAAWSFLLSRTGADIVALLCGPSALNWSWRDAGPVFAMWGAMTLAMMLPTAAPMIAAYMDIADAARAKDMVVVPAGLLAAGYSAVWLGFAVAATALQLAGQAKGTALLGESMGAGVLLIGAGAYQFSGLKHACLSKCRNPITTFMANWSDRTIDVFAMGLRQGLNCLGCCWVIMLLAFVAGLMNPLWMAAAGLFMLLEKTVSQPKSLVYGGGLGLMAAGLAQIAFHVETINAVS